MTTEGSTIVLDNYVVAGAIVFGVFASYLGYRSFITPRLSNSNSNRHGRERSMSFSSSALVRGVFPKVAKVRPPIINSLFLFKVCPGHKEIIHSLENLMCYNRFRSTAYFNGKEFVFSEIVDMNLEDFIQTSVVQSELELMSIVDTIAASDITFASNTTNNLIQPLWMFHRIVNTRSGMSSLLIRIHHVVGDGISLVNSMNKLFSDEAGKPVDIVFPNAKFTQSAPPSPRSTGSPHTSQAPKPKHSYFSVLKSALDVILLPASRYDTKTSFIGENVVQSKWVMTNRKTIIFPTVSLQFAKDLKNAANVTLNDVLYTAISGAVKKYSLLHQTQSVVNRGASSSSPLLSQLKLRSLMPIALPRAPKEQSDSLRNYFVMVSIPMPVAADSVKERLAQCVQVTSEMKTSPTPGVQMYIQNLMPRILPESMQQQTAFDIFSRHSMVFSNVPGPNTPVYLSGQRVEGIQVIFPNLIPQVLLISYAEGIFFNMVLDGDQSPGASEELPIFYIEELQQMAKAYNLDTSNMLVRGKSSGGVFDVIE